MKKLVVSLSLVGIIGVGLYQLFRDNSTLLVNFRNRFYFVGSMPATNEYKKDLSVLDKEMNHIVVERMFQNLVSEESIEELARKLSSLPKVEE